MGKGLKVCLPACLLWSTGEKCCCIFSISGLLHPCGCVCGGTRKAAAGNWGCAGATLAAELSQGMAWYAGPRASISLPRLWPTGEQSAQKPWPCQAVRERQLIPKSECFVSVSCSVNSNPTPSIGSLPKQQSGRSIKGPYILHVIPCLNLSQPGPVNISLLLGCKGPRRAAGCGGSPCCPDRGQPPFRTCNKHSEGLL